MKIQFYYIAWPSINDFRPMVQFFEPNKHEPLVLEKFNRYDYYVLGSLHWWFASLKKLDEGLNELKQLEAGELDEVIFGWNDSEVNVTLDGVHAHNYSCDSTSDQPEGQFTYQEFKYILLKYKEFLEMPKSLDTTVEFYL